MRDQLKYPCLIYDLDGTLIDSLKDIAAALNTSRAQFNLPEYSLETIMPMIGHGLKHLVECSFKDDDVDIDVALKRAEEAYRQNPFQHSTIFPGVTDTLKRFQQAGASQYIVSNKPSFLIPAVLDHLKLSHYFTKAFGGDDFEKRKPNPLAIQHILNLEKGFSLNQMLMVGDMAPDLDMARNAGIDSVFCTFGYANASLDANYTINQFSELIQITELC